MAIKFANFQPFSNIHLCRWQLAIRYDGTHDEKNCATSNPFNVKQGQLTAKLQLGSVLLSTFKWFVVLNQVDFMSSAHR